MCSRWGVHEVCRPHLMSVSSDYVLLVYDVALLFALQLHTHTTVLPLLWNMSRTIQVSRYTKVKTRKGKTNLDLQEQEIVSGSGICWAIGKSARHPRQPRQHPTTQFLQAGCPSCLPTNRVKQGQYAIQTNPGEKPLKLPLPWGTWTSSNTPIPELTPLTTPHGIQTKSAVLPQYTQQTDRQTDRQTERHMGLFTGL